VAEYFELDDKQARAIAGEVAAAVARWREEALRLGARPVEIKRMASAFEHDDAAEAIAMQR
jgi:serine/threonine-protein kinase HipA